MSRLLLLILASSLAALLLGEIGLRLMGQSYYWAFAKRVDPVLGWRPPPQSQGWQRFEGEALISTNALGFRDQDHPQAKPEDVLRIAVLGDSFTEAVQVPLDQTWWRLMGESLNKGFCASDSTIPLTVTGADAEPMPTARAEPEAELGQPAVDVLNFAVSGYSTAQSLLAWRHIAQAFSPDIVVLAFFIGNDLNENSRPLDNEPLRPYLIAEETGLTWDDRFLFSADYRSARSVSGRLWQWLREHSRILQLVLQARDALRMASFAAPQESSAAPGSKAAQMEEDQVPQELGVDNSVYLEPETEDWKKTWQVTEAMIGLFSAETRAAGAEPVIMIIGTGAQVHPNASARARFAAALGAPDLGYPVRRLVTIALQHRLPVINLPAQWTSDPRYQQQLLHGFEGGRPGFGHWNLAGHKAAAEAASKLICRMRAASSAW